MPQKPKFTKEEIVQAALNIVSQKGISALTAKELGNELGSSARPIFTVFDTMKEVQQEVHSAAMHKFEKYVQETIPNIPFFKQVGMKMVLFGINEPNLYQLLFMQENKNALTFDDIFGALGDTAKVCVEMIQKEYQLNEDNSKKLFENVWIYTFGIGTLCATRMCNFSEEKLGQMLSEEFNAMMMLLKNKNTSHEQ